MGPSSNVVHKNSKGDLVFVCINTVKVVSRVAWSRVDVHNHVGEQKRKVTRSVLGSDRRKACVNKTESGSSRFVCVRNNVAGDIGCGGCVVRQDALRCVGNREKIHPGRDF